MNKAKIKQLNKIVDKILNDKKEIPLFPIYGGASSGESTRGVTAEEASILHHKHLPVPILISINSEREFKEYVNNAASI